MTARRRPGRAVRLTADPRDVGRGLGQVVVVLLELLRDLLERQAVRRMDSGELPPAQVEDLGRALIEVRDAIAQVRDALGVSAQDAGAATARARELVGGWPPSDLASGLGTPGLRTPSLRTPDPRPLGTRTVSRGGPRQLPATPRPPVGTRHDGGNAVDRPRAAAEQPRGRA